MNSTTMELVSPPHSPFKFLDAYQKEDISYFFGRSSDIDQLYQLVCGASCLLVYGYSGVGKTSLIRCGLVNRFRLSNWLDIHVRRGNNINNSLQQAISEQLIDETDYAQELTTPERTLNLLRQLYLDYFKPVYLIFDQFEELFLLGNQQEQELFTETVKAIVTNKALKCKVILVMREEFIARLDDMEEQLPMLRQMRVRIKPLTDEVIKKEVIPLTCHHYQIQLVPEIDPDPEITSEQAPSHPVAEAIVRHVQGKSRDVSLPYIQMYLDRLWIEASKINIRENQNPLRFTEELVAQIGEIGQVLGVFLNTQLIEGVNHLKRKYPDDLIPDDLLLKVVNEFVTPKGTKRQGEAAKVLINGIDSHLIQESILWLLDARILRQVMDPEGYYEDTIYELAHDALAKHIYEHRSEDDRRYHFLRDYIDKVYKLSGQDDTSTLRHLTKDELARIQEFRSRLQAELPEIVWNYVEQSEDVNKSEIERDLQEKLRQEQEERRKETRTAQEERRLKIRGYWFAGTAFVAFCFAVIAVFIILRYRENLLKAESSRLVQLLDDYETKQTGIAQDNTPGVLYDNPSLIRQIATDAADNNERAKEWILRLDSSKNDNIFYQLSIDSHLPNPVAGFTEDGNVYITVQPNPQFSKDVSTDSIGFNVWRIDSTGTNWHSVLDKRTSYQLVGVDNGVGEPVVQLLTTAQMQVLTPWVTLISRHGLLKQYQLKSFAKGAKDTLKAFSINGRTKLALFGFASGQVYRVESGSKQLNSLNLQTAKSVQRVLFSSDGGVIIRVRKNEEGNKRSAESIQLGTTYLIEQFNQLSKELTTLKDLPYHRLDGMSISPNPDHPQYLLGPSPTDSPNAVVYFRPDTTITLLGHRVPVSVTAFSPDGRLLLTADPTGIVRIYSTRLDRDSIPIAPLLPIEKLTLGMALSEDELTEGLFKTSDWSRLTQTIFLAEEYYHRNNDLGPDFKRMLTQIGNTNLIRRQSPAAVYRFWLRLLPNLKQESNKEVRDGYTTLAYKLERHLSEELSESQVKDLIKLPETNRYSQQARGNVYILSKWVNRYPSIITGTLLNRVSQIIQTNFKKLAKEDLTNIQVITNAALQELRPSLRPNLFYPQLQELFYHLREKTEDKQTYLASIDSLAKRLRRLPPADFNRIAGSDQLLATTDEKPHWWTILADEYQRRQITQNDYQILIQGSLAFYQIMDGNYPDAIKAACRGIRLRPTDKTRSTDWIQSNLALALLLNGCTDEAKAIYEAYKNQHYQSYRYPDSKILFRQAFLDDFEVLKKQKKIKLTAYQIDQIEKVREMVLKPKSRAIKSGGPDSCQCLRQQSPKIALQKTAKYIDKSAKGSVLKRSG